MKRSIHLLGRHGVVAALLLCCIGCADYARVKSPFKHHKTKLTVAVPSDWWQYRPPAPAYVVTKDGLRLETITIRVRKVGEELPDTERVYQAGMMPNEIAELSLGLLEAKEGTKNFEVKQITTAEVAGHEGYQAEAEYVDDTGLPKRLLIRGALIGEHVCEFIYDAQDRLYFDKHEPAFQRVVSSAAVAK